MKRLNLALLLACLTVLSPALASSAFERPPRSEVIVKDPDNPKGMEIRRARHFDEAWTDYFKTVLLWPHTAEYDNRLFSRMSQNGLKISFIPETVFAVDGELVLVMHGSRQMVEQMTANVFLDGIGQRIRLTPHRAELVEDPRGDAWLGFVYFPVPEPQPERIMSSFALFNDAGGVADILDEEQVRRRYSVIRSLVDVITEEILNKP